MLTLETVQGLNHSHRDASWRLHRLVHGTIIEHRASSWDRGLAEAVYGDASKPATSTTLGQVQPHCRFFIYLDQRDKELYFWDVERGIYCATVFAGHPI